MRRPLDASPLSSPRLTESCALGHLLTALCLGLCCYSACESQSHAHENAPRTLQSQQFDQGRPVERDLIVRTASAHVPAPAPAPRVRSSGLVPQAVADRIGAVPIDGAQHSSVRPQRDHAWRSTRPASSKRFERYLPRSDCDPLRAHGCS